MIVLGSAFRATTTCRVRWERYLRQPLLRICGNVPGQPVRYLAESIVSDPDRQSQIFTWDDDVLVRQVGRALIDSGLGGGNVAILAGSAGLVR